MQNGLFLLPPSNADLIYGAEQRRALQEHITFLLPPQSSAMILEHPERLADVDVIFSGWGCPVFTAELLSAAPKLKAVFYGSGSVRRLVTDAFWDRGITLSSAWGANAVPVAEFTLAQILFSLKLGWYAMREMRRLKSPPPRRPVPGGYGSKVGILALGMIGRLVCELLRPFDVDILAYDPFLDDETFSRLGATRATLETVFQTCDVVSLHMPWLPETEGVITGHHFAMMKENATFINTARGAIVREEEMIEVLANRTDLYAVLDVTYPEPPAPESQLYQLPNVVLTPHIAGSMDNECKRMGQYMVDEFQRFLKGESLQWQVTRESVQCMA